MVTDEAGDQPLYEEVRSDSPYIECLYRARAVREERYLVPATEHWDIWFGRQPGRETIAGLGGPSLGHRWVQSTVGEYGWGVQLRAHVIVTGISKRLVLGGEMRLAVDDGRIELGGRAFDVPEFEDLEAFVDALAEAGVLRADEDVRRALAGDEAGYSERQWQRRAREATGMTRKQIAQITRAQRAFELLQQGTSPAECAAECGYSDQAHMTRSFRVFRGMTPARILAGR